MWANTERASRRLYQLIIEDRGLGEPVRFYQCKHSRSWHWTRAGATGQLPAEYRGDDHEGPRVKESTVDVGIEWVDDVPDRQQTADSNLNDLIVAELKKRPGQWARVRKNRRHHSASRPWLKRGCEVEVRNVDAWNPKDRMYDVYARWPGGTDEEAGKAPESFVNDGGVPVREKAREETVDALTVGAMKVQATEEELRRRSAQLASGDPVKQVGREPKAKLAPGKPRKMVMETDAAYKFRVQRWERGIPPQGKSPYRR